MSAYIKLTIPNDIRCSINRGLRCIICYIGNEERYCNPLLIDNHFYNKGINILNRRLHGWSKTSIKNLVCSHKTDASHYMWKLHRHKGCKVLRAISLELKKKGAPQEITSLFQNIYTQLYQLFDGDIEYRESEVLGRPYIRELSAALENDQYQSDNKDIQRIISHLEAYNGTAF